MLRTEGVLLLWFCVVGTQRCLFYCEDVNEF